MSRRAPGAEHMRPVLDFLVVLTLLPCLGLLALAGALTSNRLGEASAAGKLADRMVDMQRLASLYDAATTELTAAGVQTLINANHITLAQLNNQVGFQLAIPVAQARASTDRAVTQAWSTPALRQRIALTRDAITKARRQVDQDLIAGARPATLTVLFSGYFHAADVIQSAGTLASDQLSVAAGVGTGTALPRAVDQLKRVYAITSDIQQLSEITSQISGSPAAQRAALLDRLAIRYDTYRGEAESLSGYLSPAQRALWRKIQNSPDVIATLQATGDTVQAGIGRLTPSADGSISYAKHVVPANKQYVAFLAKAVATGVQAAEDQRRSARMTAFVTVAVALAVIVLTGVTLAVTGGRLRRRLQALAETARDFSAGQPRVIAVQGPREIGLASEAINHATLALESITEKTELLAAGELGTLASADPTPGRLGRAIDISVQRVADTVHELERLQGQLRHRADHDALTGLPNRAVAERLLTAALARAGRSGEPVGILFVDLDKFKACNDNFGHAAGDHVLKMSAQRMRAGLRQGDQVCRLGGDEFLILLEGITSERDILTIGSNVIAALHEPIRWEGNRSASAGAPVAPSPGRESLAPSNSCAPRIPPSTRPKRPDEDASCSPARRCRTFRRRGRRSPPSRPIHRSAPASKRWSSARPGPRTRTVARRRRVTFTQPEPSTFRRYGNRGADRRLPPA